ncbi:SPOR domain-containing protein [Xenorhabdus nematophila]|uniref:SPOR domain-containing protein n=1 Tax=Xenorhabdus nematophila TaxID=628 RepID=UPI000541E5C9|nr:SPOR domain-containing protein [Xenorhabdus nematophila]CEF29388.1 putative membrane protein [Xenorhabdus nematophila str. Websteri]AYA41630.1 SPOR domain-containing protein [Xenorhabdus nematophila]MBA0020369.1 SPOR domain-containing protein [Xenorhabdus nematophila]MCB4424976.1 SPOR domain-containing protein [Xenorhabdus nematophila]QNJ36016.1 SPOR domain-containing protein [Xenorhabdus nematophila]
MDELKSEKKQKTETEFKPDTSDRRPPRSKSQSNQPKLAVSRQQMMIGVGILVLLLLIIAISSALKSPTEHEKQQSSNAAEKSIDLSGSSTLSGNEQDIGQETPSVPATHGTDSKTHDISLPQPINSTSSQSLPPATNTGSYNQRIELPGDISDALNQQQSNINHSVQSNMAPLQANPTKPVLTPPIEQTKPEKVTPPKIENKGREENQPKAATKPLTNHHQTNKKPETGASGDLLKAPANRFTLQLSSASRSDTLIAFAKKHNLSHYKVYETKRDHKTWFILIHGNYSSVYDAKSAISSLPAEVQAKKPWVRKLQQVQQDLKK